MQLYENMTYERILKRMLERVPDTFDKREGSIIYDALAPAAFELAEAYIMAQVILNQSFISTADREFLIDHAADFSIFPKPATPAIVEAEFSIGVAIGTRFNAENLNFSVTELIDESTHRYLMTCETLGESGNYCIGDIIPITPIGRLQYARITKIITPGENEEDTEVFRERVKRALHSDAYGGNRDDYHQKVLAIPGVGGLKTYRCWNGGGTVKVVFLTSQYRAPEEEFVKKVQILIDPETGRGVGDGIAPIGHVVTVQGAKEVKINVSATITVNNGSIEEYRSAIKDAIDSYLENRRREWTTQDEKGSVVIRVAFIIAAILSIKNIVDVTNVRINGKEDRLTLASDEIPVAGEVTI